MLWGDRAAPAASRTTVFPHSDGYLPSKKVPVPLRSVRLPRPGVQTGNVPMPGGGSRASSPHAVAMFPVPPHGDDVLPLPRNGDTTPSVVYRAVEALQIGE